VNGKRSCRTVWNITCGLRRVGTLGVRANASLTNHVYDAASEGFMAPESR
jgi:hypothetical protein